MITVDIIGKRGKREINGTLTGLTEHVMHLIQDLINAGWVIAYSLVEGT